MRDNTAIAQVEKILGIEPTHIKRGFHSKKSLCGDDAHLFVVSPAGPATCHKCIRRQEKLDAARNAALLHLENLEKRRRQRFYNVLSKKKVWVPK